MIELLDIDLDFAVVGTAGELPRAEQEVHPGALATLQRHLGRACVERWFMDEHSHAFHIWQALGIWGARCWHLDAHHDFYGSTDVAAWRCAIPSEGSLGETSLTSATFMLLAWRAGMIREVVWMIPEWLPLRDAVADLRREMGAAPDFIHVVQSNEVEVPEPAVVTIAWSRRWIDSHLQHNVAVNLPNESRSKVVKGGTVRLCQSER